MELPSNKATTGDVSDNAKPRMLPGATVTVHDGAKLGFGRQGIADSVTRTVVEHVSQ